MHTCNKLIPEEDSASGRQNQASTPGFDVRLAVSSPAAGQAELARVVGYRKPFNIIYCSEFYIVCEQLPAIVAKQKLHNTLSIFLRVINVVVRDGSFSTPC